MGSFLNASYFGKPKMSDGSFHCTFTVFTPTYNRAHTLSRVYRSLLSQTFKNFEWLIVDDGSTDRTNHLVEGWKKEAPFPIRYFWKENEGINAAINFGVQIAGGKFFLIIGSDDAFLPETLETFLRYWTDIPREKKEQFVGVTALCQDPAGNLIGSGLPQPVVDSDAMEIRYKYKVKGEMWGFLRTEVLRRYPFPLIGNCKYLPESVVWNAIARSYKTRFIQKTLRIYWIDPEDRSDQLTKVSNPKVFAPGMAFGHRCKLNQEIHWLMWAPEQFVQSVLHYVRFSLHARIRLKEQFLLLENTPARFLWMVFFPFGLLWYFKDTKKFNKASS